MSHERYEMCMLIPFRYDNSYYENIKNGKEDFLSKYFFAKKMNCTIINQQNDDLWNDEHGNGLMKCFEIQQKYRRTLGLHNREDHNYVFKKQRDIPFKITKVYGWFLKNSMAYMTLHVKAEHLQEDQILDLKSLFVNIRENNRIQYIVKTGRDTTEEREFTIKSLIKEFLKLIKPLGPVEQKMTYSTAWSLSYGIADNLNKDAMDAFSENIRLNKKSSKKLSRKIGETECFVPEEFPYLHWALSENALALTADIGHALKIDTVNGIFLRDNLPFLIFTNYLMVYLYYLGIQEKCAQLERQCRMADQKMCMYPDQSSIQSLQNDMTEITIHEHINTLFCEYLCQNIWRIPERIELVKSKIQNADEKMDGYGLQGKYTIFISYRRVYGGYVARLIYNELRNHKKSVFYDIKAMKTGQFDEQIFEAIHNAEYVIAILTPGCLDERENEDWMREELGAAIKEKKKIINVMVDGFEFPEDLPETLAPIKKRHGLHMKAEYIDSCMEALLEQMKRDEETYAVGE